MHVAAEDEVPFTTENVAEEPGHLAMYAPECSALFTAGHACNMHELMHEYITSWILLMLAGRRQLATDVDFRWAQDSYSKTRRTVDIWAALAILRVRTWLLDAKWSSVSHPSPLSPRCPPGPEGASGAVLRECAIHIVSAILCWTLLLSAIMQEIGRAHV